MATEEEKRNAESTERSESRTNEILSERLELQRQLSKFESDIASKINKRIQLEATILENLNATKDIEKQLLKNKQSQALVDTRISIISKEANKANAERIQLLKRQIDRTVDLAAQEELYKELVTLSSNEQDLQLSILLDQKKALTDENTLYGEILIKSRQLDRGMFNILGNIVSAIPGLGKFSQVFKDAAIASRKAGGGISGMVAGFKEMGKLIPELAIISLVNYIIKADKELVSLGKALGTSSYDYRQNLASAARSTGNINVTVANLVEAFNEISQATGFAYEYTTDQLETQIRLTKQVGLQAEDAAQIQRLGVLNNKTSDETYRSFIRGLVVARNQLRVGIDFKATLAAAAKVSGQLAANLGYSPERIARAVVQAKAFGMTLEQVAKSGESLLNWESSIENELKAELITGRQLNLEKARYAALTGDQVALAEELSKQVGTSAEFTRMNVIQQKSLAEAVGMTTDELAETLRRREEAVKQGKSLAQITEEEAKKAIERQTIQDKFNATILKLQDFFNNLVAGPIGRFVGKLTESLNIITAIGAGLGTIWAISKGIAAVKAIEYGYTGALLVKDGARLTLQEAMVAAKGEELAAQIGIAAAWAISNPLQALLGLGLAAGIGALVYNAMSSVPKFANGGVISGPTLGVMGEYPGAKSNPEIVSPLSKLRDMMNMNALVTEFRSVKEALAKQPTPQFSLVVGQEKIGTIVGREPSTGTNQRIGTYSLA